MSVSNMSGSTGINSLIQELENLVGDHWVENALVDMCKPTYILQFDKTESNKIWLYNEVHRTFLPYPWGVQVEPLDEYTQQDKEVACMIGHDVVMVPPNYILDIGWH